jgi:hypothetical protein
MSSKILQISPVQNLTLFFAAKWVIDNDKEKVQDFREQISGGDWDEEDLPDAFYKDLIDPRECKVVAVVEKGSKVRVLPLVSDGQELVPAEDLEGFLGISDGSNGVACAAKVLEIIKEL